MTRQRIDHVIGLELRARIRALKAGEWFNLDGYRYLRIDELHFDREPTVATDTPTFAIPVPDAGEPDAGGWDPPKPYTPPRFENEAPLPLAGRVYRSRDYCATCDWWWAHDRDEDVIGKCRRHAPKPGWPNADRTDWCGDHEPRRNPEPGDTKN